VEGVWDRVRHSNGLVPLEVEGTVPMRDFLEQPPDYLTFISKL
jgi:hypothetical protein